MGTPARLLEKLKSRPSDFSDVQLVSLLKSLEWGVRNGKGSHLILTSPRGYNITCARKNRRISRVYLDMILKELD